MSVSREYTPQYIGRSFAKHYYNILSTNPAELYKFYCPDAQLLHAEDLMDTTMVAGTLAIQERISQFNLFGSQINMSKGSIDAVRYDASHLLVVVTGVFTALGAAPRSFTQSFVLVGQQNSYFVSSSVFRLLPSSEVVVIEKVEVAVPVPVTPEPAPAQTQTQAQSPTHVVDTPVTPAEVVSEQVVHVEPSEAVVVEEAKAEEPAVAAVEVQEEEVKAEPVAEQPAATPAVKASHHRERSKKEKKEREHKKDKEEKKEDKKEREKESKKEEKKEKEDKKEKDEKKEKEEKKEKDAKKEEKKEAQSGPRSYLDIARRHAEKDAEKEAEKAKESKPETSENDDSGNGQVMEATPVTKKEKKVKKETDASQEKKDDTVHITGFPADTASSLLQSIFSQFGEVKQIRLIKDYGFVTFADASCAQNLLSIGAVEAEGLSLSVHKRKRNKFSRESSGVKEKKMSDTAKDVKEAVPSQDKEKGALQGKKGKKSTEPKSQRKDAV